MKKNKLLFINGHLNVGGVEKSLFTLLSSLDYSKYDVDLLLLEDRGVYSEQIPKNVNVIFFDTTKAYGPLLKTVFFNFITFRWLAILYRLVLFFSSIFGKSYLSFLGSLLSLKSFYDVAIAYRPGISADIAAYAVKANKKILWWHHGEINIASHCILEYDETWKHFDNVIAVSYGCKQMLTQTFQYPEDQILVLPNIIDVDQIQKMAGTESPYRNNKLKIISVGRLCIEKHFEDAINVAKRLVNDGMYDFHWYIVGDGELQEDLANLIDKNGIHKYVTLLGKQSNPYPWIKYADVFVHSSYVESQGIAILEAMALGIPCVVCRSLGSSEFVINGENAILTDQNEYSLYSGVNLILNLDSTKDLVKKALITVEERFSKNYIMQKFDELVIINKKK